MAPLLLTFRYLGTAKVPGQRSFLILDGCHFAIARKLIALSAAIANKRHKDALSPTYDYSFVSGASNMPLNAIYLLIALTARAGKSFSHFIPQGDRVLKNVFVLFHIR